MSHPIDRPRAIFDCNVLVQAVAFGGSPAAKCLRLVESNEVELFISKATVAELRKVLAYDEVLAISPNMTPERIAAFLQRLTFRATLIRQVKHVMHYPRDPADEPYIDLAVATKAHYLVSRDNDLLSLMTSHSPIARQFRQRTRPLRVVNPNAFLKAMKHETG